ncbi:MAG: DUF3108 domain-containing protein [Proteobacteria bacterium]|nr:MAG: DUF3108 domain-containing protein [Pseudomonadota bacterium]
MQPRHRTGNREGGRRRLAVLCAAFAVLMVPAAARAQAKLDARYTASLAGIPIGAGNWIVNIGEDRYSAVVNGGTSGLLKAFAGATGSGLIQGRVVNGAFAPATYLVSTTSRKKTETIRIALAGGGVKDFSIEPEEDPNPDRIPVTEAHKRGVLDPMTASLLRVAGNGNPLGPQACQGSTAIFDGRMRYELRLAYKRMAAVKAEKGYQGPAVVCGVYFTPVAGYVPDRAAIKYLAAQRDMEVWFAPIAGTRVLVPFKVTIPTPLGTGTLEATEFVVSATVAQGTSRTH